MTITRKALRVEIAADLGEGYAGTATTFPAAGDYFVDTYHLDSGDSEYRWEGAWVLFTSGALDGTERKVTAFDNDAGKFTLSRAAPATYTPSYELHTLMSATDMNTCINRALARCTYEKEQNITPVASQLQYSLAAYTAITDQGQIRRVYWREGNLALTYTFTSLPFRVFNNGGVLTLHINPYAFGVGSSAMIVLTYKGPYAALDTDVVTTICDTDWVKTGAVLQMYDTLINKGTAQDAARFERKRNEYAARFSHLTRAYAPRKIVRFGLENDDIEIYE